MMMMIVLQQLINGFKIGTEKAKKTEEASSLKASLLRFGSFIRGKAEKGSNDDGGKLDRDRVIYMT